MSFSSEVKEELAKQFGRSRHCQIAELAGILELEGMLDEEGKLVVSNENSLLQTKYGLLLLYYSLFRRSFLHFLLFFDLLNHLFFCLQPGFLCLIGFILRRGIPEHIFKEHIL